MGIFRDKSKLSYGPYRSCLMLPKKGNRVHFCQILDEGAMRGGAGGVSRKPERPFGQVTLGLPDASALNCFDFGVTCKGWQVILDNFKRYVEAA